MYCHQCGGQLKKSYDKLHCSKCKQDYRLATIGIDDSNEQKDEK